MAAAGVGVRLRTFRVDDAAGHAKPLHAAARHLAGIAQRIDVAQPAFQHIGHAFEAAMRRLGKVASRGAIHMHFVEQQKRIDVRKRHGADDAADADAGGVGRGDAAEALDNGTRAWNT